jgi:hypothetical protein
MAVHFELESHQQFWVMRVYRQPQNRHQGERLQNQLHQMQGELFDGAQKVLYGVIWGGYVGLDM